MGLAALQVQKKQIGVAVLETRVGQFLAVGRDTGKNADRIIMSQAADIRAVIIDEIYFLMAGLIVGEGDLRVRDARLAGQGLHDVIGQTMGSGAPVALILTVIPLKSGLLRIQVEQLNRSGDLRS